MISQKAAVVKKIVINEFPLYMALAAGTGVFIVSVLVIVKELT